MNRRRTSVKEEHSLMDLRTDELPPIFAKAPEQNCLFITRSAQALMPAESPACPVFWVSYRSSPARAHTSKHLYTRTAMRRKIYFSEVETKDFRNREFFKEASLAIVYR